MNVRSSLRVARAAALLWACAAPGEAAAQFGTRVASFNVATEMDDSTGYDRWYAIVFPRGQSRDGALMWSCGDDPGRRVAAVRLPREGTDGAERTSLWRFNREAPDTVRLVGSAGSHVWMLHDGDVDAFTRRARTMERVTLRLPAAAAGEPAEYVYRLPGADSALSSLRCAEDAEVAGVPSGRATLRRLSSEPFLHDDGRLDTDTVPTGWMPRLLNLGEFYQELVRRYPPDLRDAGIAGDVDLRIRVLEDGTVDLATARVLRSSHELFTPVALAALKRMRFRPAVRNGRATAVWVTLPIQFQTAA